jgi:hypothetical protein
MVLVGTWHGAGVRTEFIASPKTGAVAWASGYRTGLLIGQAGQSPAPIYLLASNEAWRISVLFKSLNWSSVMLICSRHLKSLCFAVAAVVLISWNATSAQAQEPCAEVVGNGRPLRGDPWANDNIIGRYNAGFTFWFVSRVKRNGYFELLTHEEDGEEIRGWMWGEYLKLAECPEDD